MADNNASSGCHPPSHSLLTFNNHKYSKCSIPASVREGVKNLTPPPLSQDFLGVGGLDPLMSQLSPKRLNFLLKLYFSRSFWNMLAEIACFRALYNESWGQKRPLCNEKGGGSPVSVTPEWSHCWNWCPDPLPQPLYL